LFCDGGSRRSAESGNKDHGLKKLGTTVLEEEG